MGEQDAFERSTASLHEAVLSEARWPETLSLIDEACGLTGNQLMVGEGPKDDVRVAQGPGGDGVLRPRRRQLGGGFEDQ